MKPRHCRSSWRDLASTYPLTFPSTHPREILFACSPFPPWNLPFFTAEHTVSSPSSGSDSPLSRQVAAFAHLESFDLTIWWSGQIALFLFLLAKAALQHLPTALSVALRPLFPFQQAQYDQIFPLKPAPFCKVFAGLGSTNKSTTSLLLFSDSCQLVICSAFPFTSIFRIELAGTVFSLLRFYQATIGPRTLVSPGE